MIPGILTVHSILNHIWNEHIATWLIFTVMFTGCKSVPQDNMSCGQAYDGHRSSWDTGENLGHLAISVGHQPTALVGHTFGGTPAALVGHTCHLVAIVSHLLLELVAHCVLDCPQTFLDFKTEDFHRGEDARCLSLSLCHCVCENS